MLQQITSHSAFRVAVAAATLVLTGSLLLGLAINSGLMAAYAPLSRAEHLQSRLLVIAFTIPLLVGLLGVLPHRRAWSRVLGRALVYIVSPILLATLLISRCISLPSEEFFWVMSWMLFAIGYWRLVERGVHE